MQASIDIHIGTPGEEVKARRLSSCMKTTHWITISVTHGESESDLSVFGTPEQLDAFIDQVAALRSVEQKAAA